jgi:hypothetical protein
MLRRVLWFGWMLWVAACPRPGGEKPLVPKATDPAWLVPDGVMGVGFLDLPYLLAHPALKGEAAVVQPLVDKIRTEIGIDPGLLKNAILVYAPLPGEQWVLRGAALLPGNLKDSPGLSGVIPSSDPNEPDLYVVGKGFVRAAFLEGVTVIGDAASVRGILEVAAGRRPALPATDRLRTLVKALSAFPIRLAVRVNPDLLGRFPLFPEEMRNLGETGFGIDVTEKEVRLTLVVLSERSQWLATKLGGQLTRLTEQLRQSSLLRILGDLLASGRVEAEKDRVSLRFGLPMSLVRLFLPLVLKSLRL